ncbi:response regulator [bacterium CPR1]|nr:response regulator [bacterium CPR1]
MRRKPKGLSFLELLVAMTITFLAISFLMGLFVNAARNNDRSHTYSTAAFLAQGRMEVLAATPIDQLVTGSDTFAGNFSSYVYEVDVQDAGDYDGDGIDDGDLKVISLKVTAPGGKEAVEVVRARGAELALVILDLTMPVMSGAKTFDAIRALAPGLKVLLYSGYSLDGQAQELMARGCDDFIQKPFDLELLASKLAALVP